MSWFSNVFNNLKVLAVDRLSDGGWFYTLFNSKHSWINHSSDAQKLKLVLINPAILNVILLQCELASLGKFYIEKPDGTFADEDPLLDLLNKPNPFQTGRQMIWDFNFWKMLGVARLYVDREIAQEGNKLYFLSPDCLTFPKIIEELGNKIILSDKAENEIKKAMITYKSSNQKFTFPVKKLINIFDISNGLGNWFSSPSRIDALYKIVSNSDKALDSKNINAEFVSKFLVAGKAAVEDTSSFIMGEPEKQSIRESMRSGENVYPLKTMVDIKRFVENAGVLTELDKSFLGDYYLCGKLFGIPRDVLEAYESSTYENQEKARMSHVTYTIQPGNEELCEALSSHFGYKDKKLVIDYSHLPFMQAGEKDRSETNKNNAEALVKLVDAGADQQQAADYLGIEVEMKNPRNENRQQETNGKGVIKLQTIKEVEQREDGENGEGTNN